VDTKRIQMLQKMSTAALSSNDTESRLREMRDTLTDPEFWYCMGYLDGKLGGQQELIQELKEGN